MQVLPLEWSNVHQVKMMPRICHMPESNNTTPGPSPQRSDSQEASARLDFSWVALCSKWGSTCKPGIRFPSFEGSRKTMASFPLQDEARVHMLMHAHTCTHTQPLSQLLLVQTLGSRAWEVFPVLPSASSSPTEG